MNIFEINFYQDHKKWRPKLILIDVSENDPDRVIDLLIYKNHFAPIKELNEFLGGHHRSFVCRQCLKSYTIENMILLHEPNVKILIKLTLEHQVNHIFNGKNNFIRIHCILKYTQILYLIMKSIFPV